jgi:hypothetical protein
MEAARHWAAYRPAYRIDESAVAEMRALGVPAESIAGIREEDEDDQERFLVYPCNWPTVQAFLRLTRAWNVAAGMAGLIYLGLRPEACESVLRLMRIPDSERLEVFDGLRVMESAALEVMNRE